MVVPFPVLCQKLASPTSLTLARIRVSRRASLDDPRGAKDTKIATVPLKSSVAGSGLPLPRNGPARDIRLL